MHEVIDVKSFTVFSLVFTNVFLSIFFFRVPLSECLEQARLLPTDLSCIGDPYIDTKGGGGVLWISSDGEIRRIFWV